MCLVGSSLLLFVCANLDSAQVLAQRIAHQCRAVSLGLLGNPVGGLQELFIEHNLHCFHMWTPVHSILNTKTVG